MTDPITTVTPHAITIRLPDGRVLRAARGEAERAVILNALASGGVASVPLDWREETRRPALDATRDAA